MLEEIGSHRQHDKERADEKGDEGADEVLPPLITNDGGVNEQVVVRGVPHGDAADQSEGAGRKSSVSV